MPVNLPPPIASELLAVPGVELGVSAANIRKPGRSDLLLIRLVQNAKVAGVFTRNRFCAAPVQVAREHLARSGSVRALVVNTGNANAGTGAPGLEHAQRTCAEVGGLLSCAADQVLPFSTGVIMEPLPVERIVNGLPACVADLRPDNWFAAAQAIMTTDTVPKAVSKRVMIDGRLITVTGIAKGAGMIHPDMATMLGFIASDARVSAALVKQAVSYAAQRSFNAITVDGDTSTNDSFILIASGQVDMPEINDPNNPGFTAWRDAVAQVASSLAQAIVRDGEGATKFITLRIEGGRNEEECRCVGFSIAHSPLVKTAFFASDPNLGRILAAIGNSGIADLDTGKIDLYLDNVLVASGGGRDPRYQETDGQRVMKQPEIVVRVVLNRGSSSAELWTCDFSHEYVSINADYRS